MPGREVMPPRLQRLSTVCSYDLAICDHLSNDAGRPFSLSGMEKFIGLSSTNDFSRSIPNHWTTLSMTGWSLLMVRPVFLGGSCHRTPSSPLKKYERKHKVLASRWQYWTKLNIWGLHTLYIYIYIYIHIQSYTHVCVYNNDLTTGLSRHCFRQSFQTLTYNSRDSWPSESRMGLLNHNRKVGPEKLEPLKMVEFQWDCLGL